MREERMTKTTWLSEHFSEPSFAADKPHELLLNRYLNSKLKRAFDLLFTILILPLGLPLLLLCMAWLLASVGLPVIFAQNRVGLNGRQFTMHKLRTLRNGANNHNGTRHEPTDITKVGGILRLLRLDELPQMWNIIKGEMSWVGPRPEIPFYVERFDAIDPDFRFRLLALPGITGMAQLNNPNATPDDNLDKLKHDLEYIQKASLWMDIKILLKTFLVIWKN